MVVLQIGIVLLLTTFISTLFATQEPKNLHQFNWPCGFIDRPAVIKYHQLLSKVKSNKGKSHFDQLATASSSTPP